MRPYVLGIDIGTSYTAAAVGRRQPDGSIAYDVLELGTRRAAVPTVVYLGEDGSVVVGEPAERRAIEQPDRVVLEFKRRIGDETPIILGDLAVGPEDLFAVLAAWVVDRAEAREGVPPESIAISHPATWGEHRLGLIRSALAGVGLASVDLVSEPEAAGLHYLTHAKVKTGDAVAVYDLGGGTFDVAILRKQQEEAFTLVGTPGGIERLGGADFDQCVFEHVRSLAADAFASVDGCTTDEAMALARVRRECTEAKEALSFDAETVVPVLLPRGQRRVRIVRSEFEQMIDEPLRRTIVTLRNAIDDAGLEPGDAITVLLIGGSSRIPAVTQLISSELELPVAIHGDPKASICLGAAVAASRQLAPDASAPAPVAAADSPVPVAAAPAPVALTPHRPSLGLRTVAVAAVAVALMILVIPITRTGTLGFVSAVEPTYPQREPIAGSPGTPSLQSDADPAASARAPGGGAEPAATAREQGQPTAATSRNSASRATLPTATQPPSGPDPVPTPESAPAPTQALPPAPDPVISPSPEAVPDGTPDPSPEPVPSPQPVPTPIAEPQPEPSPTSEPSPQPLVSDPQPVSDATVGPSSASLVEQAVTPAPALEPTLP